MSSIPSNKLPHGTDRVACPCTGCAPTGRVLAKRTVQQHMQKQRQRLIRDQLEAEGSAKVCDQPRKVRINEAGDAERVACTKPSDTLISTGKGVEGASIPTNPVTQGGEPAVKGGLVDKPVPVASLPAQKHSIALEDIGHAPSTPCCHVRPAPKADKRPWNDEESDFSDDTYDSDYYDTEDDDILLHESFFTAKQLGEYYSSPIRDSMSLRVPSKDKNGSRKDNQNGAGHGIGTNRVQGGGGPAKPPTVGGHVQSGGPGATSGGFHSSSNTSSKTLVDVGSKLPSSDPQVVPSSPSSWTGPSSSMLDDATYFFTSQGMDITIGLYDPREDPGPWEPASLYDGPSSAGVRPKGKLTPARFVLTKKGKEVTDATLCEIETVLHVLYQELMEPKDPMDQLGPRQWRNTHPTIYERIRRTLTTTFPVLASRDNWKARRCLDWHIDKRKSAIRSKRYRERVAAQSKPTNQSLPAPESMAEPSGSGSAHQASLPAIPANGNL